MIRQKILESFKNFLPELVDCEIISSRCLPEGIKAHTRSVAWIAEQVIIQATRKHIDCTHFEYCTDAESDTDVMDCECKIGKDVVLINIKVSAAKKPTKNDINKAYKIWKLFKDNPNTLLFYVVFKMRFEHNQVKFVNEPPEVFYVPYVKNIYVNPSQHHLQAYYYDNHTVRTVKEFTDEIDKQVKEKKIKRI